jgi:hypothetical protein
MSIERADFRKELNKKTMQAFHAPPLQFDLASFVDRAMDVDENLNTETNGDFKVNGDFSVTGDIGTATATEKLTFKTNSLSRLTITPLGTVGINTTSPDDALDIVNPPGSSYTGLNLKNTAVSALNPGGGRLAVSPDGQFNLNNTGACPIKIMTDGMPRIFVSGNGLIGINTVTPDDIVDIVNPPNTSYTALNLKNTAVSALNPGGGRLVVSPDGHFNLNNTGACPIKIMTAGVTRIFAAGDGNVGIGTMTPDSKLDVAGTLTCTGLNVISNGEMDAGYVTTDTGFGYEYSSLPSFTTSMLGYTQQFTLTATQAMASGTALTPSLNINALPMGIYTATFNSEITPSTAATLLALSVTGGTNLTLLSPTSAHVGSVGTSTWKATLPLMFRINAANPTLTLSATITGAAGTWNSGTLTVMRIA